jgi:hypothetical protein
MGAYDMTPKEQTLDDILGILYLEGNLYDALDDDIRDTCVNRAKQSLLEELKKHAAEYITKEYSYERFDTEKAVPLSVIESLLGKGE